MPKPSKTKQALFEPADRGEWTLPDELVRYRDTAVRLGAAFDQLQPPRDIIDVQAEVIAAAKRADDPVTLDVTVLLDHERDMAEYDQRSNILRIAWEQAQQDLNATIHELADQVIIGHLQPALTKLWAHATKQVNTLADVNVDSTDSLLSASDKQRRAWLDLDDTAARYARLRLAWDRIRTGQPQYDGRSDHAEYETGRCRIWPESMNNAKFSLDPTPPWPTDPRQKLVWMVRNSHTPWLPTIQQQDDAWMTTHRRQWEEAQHQGRQQRQARAFVTAFAQ